MPNPTALCHEHKCDRCSMYLEHLLLSACAAEICTHLTGLKQWLDYAWPTAVNDIHKDVSQLYCRHCCAVKNAQHLLFLMEVDMPNDICYWIRLVMLLATT